MVLILLIFRAGIIFSGKYLKRPFGYILLLAYAVSTIVSYLLPGPG
jgi:hypothetical protein